MCLVILFDGANNWPSLRYETEFEDLAIGVLDICYETDKKMAKLALVRKLIEWGDTTCLDIAYAAEQMKFMEHDCCQTKLQRVWKGNTQIHTLGQWALFFSAMIFPFLIPKMTFLIKDYKEVLSVENNQKQLHSNQVKTSFGEKMKNLFCRWKSEFPNTGYETRRIGGQLDDVTFWEGIGYYYKAPITKFLWNIYSYITLLVLFSWFILTDLRPSNEENSPGTVEKIVMGWVGTLIIEELRQ
ncbi:transient receptor potential cation channel subfamily M member-like 2, partial [Saccoglossus kowalevskii]